MPSSFGRHKGRGEYLRDRFPIAGLKGILQRAVIFEQRFSLTPENGELGGYRRRETGEPTHSSLHQRPHERKAFRFTVRVDPLKRYLGDGTKSIDGREPFPQIGFTLIREGKRDKRKGVMQGKSQSCIRFEKMNQMLDVAPFEIFPVQTGCHDQPSLRRRLPHVRRHQLLHAATPE